MEGKTKVRMIKKSFLYRWRVGEEGYIEGCISDMGGHMYFAIVLGNRIIKAENSDFEVIQKYSVKK